MSMSGWTLEGETSELAEGLVSTSDVEAGDGHVRERERGVVRGGLIEAVVEGVEQRAVQAEACADGGLAVAADVPREADARLGEELRAVGCEGEEPMVGLVLMTPLVKP